AHEVARPEQQVEEIEAAGPELERLVALDRREQLLLQERGQVGVGAARELVEIAEEGRVRRERLVARDAAAVVPIESLSGSAELPAARHLDQPRLERVLITGRDLLAESHVVRDPAREPGVGGEAVGRGPTRAPGGG